MKRILNRIIRKAGQMSNIVQHSLTCERGSCRALMCVRVWSVCVTVAVPTCTAVRECEYTCGSARYNWKHNKPSYYTPPFCRQTTPISLSHTNACTHTKTAREWKFVSHRYTQVKLCHRIKFFFTWAPPWVYLGGVSGHAQHYSTGGYTRYTCAPEIPGSQQGIVGL